MQALAWVVSTVLLKFLLSTVLCASDDVRVRLRTREGRSRHGLFCPRDANGGSRS